MLLTARPVSVWYMGGVIRSLLENSLVTAIWCYQFPKRSRSEQIVSLDSHT